MPVRFIRRDRIDSHRVLTLILVAMLSLVAKADTRLPAIFSSHAVLQRDEPIHVWGWSDPGEMVSASLDGPSQRTTADKLGKWSLYLPLHAAGGPFQLTITGKNRIVLDDILIGDVWFASGQSNMEMPLGGFPGSAVVKNAEEEIKNASHPRMRLLLIPHRATPYPQSDLEGDVSWQLCSPETAAKFSAVAYFFGREIEAKEQVPVGLIDSTWGGTPGEAWVSLDALSADSSLMAVFASWGKMADEQSDVPTLRKAERAEDDEARRNHAAPPKHSWHPDPASWNPSWLFNGMVAPLVDFPIKGVIWYQGETNSRLDRAPFYQKVFSTLIADWRRHWHQENAPFLFTQISSFKSDETEDWAALREAQLRTLSVAGTAMAVTIDVGDPDNVHPSDKQTVGARLALAARAIAYRENIEYSGPIFRNTSTEEGAIRVWFTHTDRGLMAKGEALQGFEIAGEDHRFISAAGRIDGACVVLNNSEISAPKYVRYGWRNAPTVNLFNSAGLPASPFTSE